MIEIIKQGTKKKTNCKICGCVFTYEQEDIEVERINSYKTEYLTCPQCEEKVIIAMEK